MAPIVERVTDGSTELGEGPHWDVKRQTLYYVDIFGKSIHSYKPTTNEHSKAVIGKHVGFILPVEGSDDKFLIGMERELVIVTWDGISETVSKMEKLAEVDQNPEALTNRFNDGKADPSGRVWAGTMGTEPENGQVAHNRGAFYSFGPNRELKLQLKPVHISNGLAWSADAKKFYYIDSGTKKIEQFDFDIKNGTISNRQTLFSFEKHNLNGIPDGQTIDTDGNLWVAVFMGNKVLKIDTKKPETLLETIAIPAHQVTSVAFGGPNLDELYVTSARFTIAGKVLKPPQEGAVYRVKGTGAKGFPAVAAKI